MDEPEEFTPRAYQIDLYEKAMEGNTIIYLPTGSGKTYIVVMVIKKMSSDVRIPWDEGGKRTLFLVNTVPLVAQQCAYISRHSDLSCNGYSGDMNVDMWDADMWREEFNRYQVLVMTSQILLDLLNHGYLPLTRINLIIFDECHHAVGDHPMRSIMKRFEDCPVELQPKVLGTSATLLNSNVKLEKVEENVRDLEITFHAKVITVDSLAPIKGYGKPTEMIHCYDSPIESNIQKSLDKYIDYAIEVLDMVNLSQIASQNESSKIFQPRSKSLKLKCIFEDIREHCKTQGLYVAFKAILYHMVQLEQIKRCLDDPLSLMVLDFLITKLTIMRKVIAMEMKGTSELDNIEKYSSDQVQKLFHVIKKFYNEHTSEKDKFCCIIFVRRRFTAKILYHVLKCLADCDDEFKFLTPQYVVGNSADPFKSPFESMCLQKWSEESLSKFRAGVVNCLVATDVLDEGIDVPSCSLVIRYDTPLDFRAYVQSKGRSRHKNSHYILLSANNPELIGRYNQYRRVEMTLSIKLIGNSQQRLSPLPEDMKQILYATEIEPFCVINSKGIKSFVTDVSAISLINRYCSTLSRSKFVNCGPIWTLFEDKENINEVRYLVKIQMPMTSPLRDTIVGNMMSSIISAKRSAAMEACKKLYSIGELTDNFLPKNAAQIVEDIESLLVNWEEEDEVNKKTVGTTTTKRPHDIIYPEALYAASPLPNQNCYLHIISVKPTYPMPTEGRNWKFYEMLHSNETYAILSRKQFPKIPNFPIHMNVGPLEAKIIPNSSTVILSSDEIMQLRQFHWVIFKEVLELIKSFMIFDNADEENSYLIGPVDKNWNIDWDIVRRYPSIRREAGQNHSMRAITNDSNFTPVVDDECGWQLVTPNYRSSTNMYVVTRICDELTPKSVFPTDDYISYIHYFQGRHGLTITDEKQSLLEVKPISKKINCIKFRDQGRSMNKRKREDLEEHLIPELCYRVIFPALYWLKATLLPSILHRVSQLLLADDLRRLIASETALGIIDIRKDDEWQPLVLEQQVNDESNDTFLQMETILDESIPLEHGKSNLVPSSPDVDALSLDAIRYPWPKDHEPCDLDRNIEKVQLIDCDYYHQFTKSYLNINHERIKSKYRKRGYATRSKVTVPSLNVLKCSITSTGPTPADIIPALTPKFANDAFNLERLETLGDAYLKFITSIYLFDTYPFYNEGRLTSAKGKIIGNRYLYYCGKSKSIPGRLKVDEFEPMSNFIVPSFSTPRQLQKAVRLKNKSPNVLYEINVPIDEQIAGELSASSELDFLAQIDAWVEAKNTTGVEQFVGFQIVPDKTVSDAVEALTGVYLNSMGLKGAARFLRWLGVLPKDIAIDKVLNGKPSTARIGAGDINVHMPAVNYIENVLGYKFTDRSFILQAFTHPSYTPNRITSAYERLEFLGDAIIDFLITVYIYENCGDLSPGALTDLRSALVNNITFACLTVKYGLHTALLSHAPSLSETIERFVKYQEERDHIIDDELLWILLEEDECNMAEFVDVPKILGDLFESVIGAIYLDSGKNLNIVWEILYSLMYNEINSFSRNVPKQPVRVIYETPGAHPRFLNSESVDGTSSIMVPLEVQISKEKKLFHGFGSTKRQAKAAAAKLALKAFKHNG
ncbi:hypothetical protein PV326_008304 [Microctonus aethiopoides]|nr:hypothetical protein PV326_008304 [Microctonus aethiopoides]